MTMVPSMSWAIFWLIVQIAVLIGLWDHWEPRQNLYFAIGMGLLIISQLYTIGYTYWRNLKTRDMLKELLQDSNDRMEDAIRDPDDNTPYERYNGRMKPVDQVRYMEQLKQRDENGNGTT